METYRVIGVGADRGVGDRADPDLLDVGVVVLVGSAAGVGRIIDDVGDAVDESNHGMFPVTDMITKPLPEGRGLTPS
jgi:predicted RecA/RadA family phage recombinase